MSFQKAVKQAGWAKMSFQGLEKSGKTTTAAETAIYLTKKYHPGKPVAFVASEQGIDFVLDMFAAEGVEVLEQRSRAFVALQNSIPEAIKAGAGVLLIDSATTYWQEIVDAYKKANRITRKLKPFEYTPIKEQWREGFSNQFTPAKIDILVCGRLGYEYEELRDDEGEQEISRIGTKMKTEGDFNYETDLIVEMMCRPDDSAGNAAKVKIGKRNKLVRQFNTRNVHIAKVNGSRVRALNGKSFQFPANSEYVVGESMRTGACFAPYFEFLKNNGAQGNVLDNQNSVDLFDRTDSRDFAAMRLQRTQAVEEIKGALGCVWAGATGNDAKVKLQVLDALFETTSWTAVEESLPLDKVEHGATVCRRMKSLVELAKKIPADRDELLALVKQATDEIRDEIANPIEHKPNGQGLLGVMEMELQQAVPF